MQKYLTNVPKNCTCQTATGSRVSLLPTRTTCSLTNIQFIQGKQISLKILWTPLPGLSLQSLGLDENFLQKLERSVIQISACVNLKTSITLTNKSSDYGLSNIRLLCRNQKLSFQKARTDLVGSENLQSRTVLMKTACPTSKTNVSHTIFCKARRCKIL